MLDHLVRLDSTKKIEEKKHPNSDIYDAIEKFADSVTQELLDERPKFQLPSDIGNNDHYFQLTGIIEDWSIKRVIGNSSYRCFEFVMDQPYLHNPQYCRLFFNL